MFCREHLLHLHCYINIALLVLTNKLVSNKFENDLINDIVLIINIKDVVS